MSSKICVSLGGVSSPQILAREENNKIISILWLVFLVLAPQMALPQMEVTYWKSAARLARNEHRSHLSSDYLTLFLSIDSTRNLALCLSTNTCSVSCYVLHDNFGSPTVIKSVIKKTEVLFFQHIRLLLQEWRVKETEWLLVYVNLKCHSSIFHSL